MIQNYCYICNIELKDSNLSYEHIIPACLGGSLKSRDLLCVQCNSTFGEIHDKALAAIGIFYLSKYNIPKKKSLNYTFNAVEKRTKKNLIISPSWITKFKDTISVIDENNNICIEAPNKKRAMQEINRIKILYQSHNFEDIEFNEKLTPEVQDFEYEPEVYEELILRAICKTIANYYIFKTKNKDNISKLIEYIISDNENYYCWGFNLNIALKYYGGKTYHIINIIAIKDKYMYAYFEIFGETGFIILLNARYVGPDENYRYIYDVINKTEILNADDFQIDISLSDICEIIKNKADCEWFKSLNF